VSNFGLNIKYSPSLGWENWLVINVDGASKRNPGPATGGDVFEDQTGS